MVAAAWYVTHGERDAADDFWYGPAGKLSAANMPVDALRSMQSAAVFASVKVLAESLAQLPLTINQRRPDGGHEPAENHPLFEVLHDRPNSNQSSFEWREMMSAHLVLKGNAYSEIIPGPRGAVDQLIPLHPDRVTPQRLSTGRIVYRVTRERGGQEILNQESVFHVKGLVWDGVAGIDPIGAAAREAIGIALGAQQFSGRFLANDARPSGIIEFAGKFRSDEDKRKFRESWQLAQTGGQFGKTAILQQGMEWKDVGMSNRQAQFLEQRRYSDVEIARIFRIPPHMIGILDRATFSNIEQQAIDFVVHTLLPWIRRWEQAITLQLVLAPRTFFPKFNVAGLLRGDLESRYKAYAVGRQWGWLSANDVRRLEDMNPVLGGDIYLSPSNMAPADQLGAAPAGVKLLAQAGAERVLRKELTAVGRAYDRMIGERPDDFGVWVQDFYDGLAPFVSETLKIGANASTDYTQSRLAEIVTAFNIEINSGDPAVRDVLEAWAAAGENHLTALCMEAINADT